MGSEMNFEFLVQLGILICMIVLIFKAIEIREDLDRIKVEMEVGINKINENLRDIYFK